MMRLRSGEIFDSQGSSVLELLAFESDFFFFLSLARETERVKAAPRISSRTMQREGTRPMRVVSVEREHWKRAVSPERPELASHTGVNSMVRVEA
jgi:hypothetical protein